ncbi:MAG: DUF429 domain-containing protein [Clostridia bacterium]|nr:DUF429 domain-containing protein [Clostridia bacterium]NCC75501.1 DUF429 domain-containing protein [Clostridia bacterium]
MANEILTLSGIRFNPFQATFSDIQISDIAHALSLMTRANGHIRTFYSIAQHSVNCCLEARARDYSQRVQLACLLHDASESYLSDLTRPVKKQLGGYAAVEAALQGLIYAKYGLADLSEQEKEQVRAIDDALLHHEFAALRGILFFADPPIVERDHDFSQRDFASVEMEFLDLFLDLELASPAWHVVGVDGCRSGWVSVCLTDRLADVSWSQSIAEVWARGHQADCLLLDMPVGLPSGLDDIRPEPQARPLLPGRAATLFPVPCRQAAYAHDYTAANAVNRETLGRGLSRQSYALCAAIREVDGFLEHEPEAREKMWESHPELCFAFLNGHGRSFMPLASKHTAGGRQERTHLLSAYEPRTREILARAGANPRLSHLHTDVLDALALAVCAKMGLHQGFRSIPHHPMQDQKGHWMQIRLPQIIHGEFTQYS